MLARLPDSSAVAFGMTWAVGFGMPDEVTLSTRQHNNGYTSG